MQSIRAFVQQLMTFREVVKMTWLTYLCATVMVILAALLTAVTPYLLGSVVDAVRETTLAIATTAKTPPTSLHWPILGPLLLMVLAHIGAGVLANLSAYLSATKAEYISHLLRETLARTIFHDRADHSVLLKQDRGRILAHFNRDIEALWDFCGFAMTEMISSVVLVITLCIIVMFMEPYIGLLLLLLSILFGCAYFFNGQRIRAHFAKAAPRFDHMISLCNALLDGYETIAAFQKQRWAQAGLSRLSQEVTTLANRAHRRSTLFDFMTSTVNILGVLAVWILCLPGLLGMPGASVKISIGELIAIVFYFGMIARPLETISGAAKALSKGSVSLKRLSDFVRAFDAAKTTMPVTSTPTVEPATKPASTKAASCSTPQAILQLHKLSYQPHSERLKWLLKHISLAVHAGEFIGIAGASGSGKTTLMRVIARLLPIDNNLPSLNGTVYTEIAEDIFRQKVLYLPQSTSVFPVSLLENIFLETCVNENGLERNYSHEAKSVLHLAGLEHKYQDFMRHTDLLSARISGGEAQRLSLSRAFIKDPDLLLIDEPTSALDLTNSARIAEALLRFSQRRQGCAVIVASHDATILDQCSHILLLEQGRIVRTGTHSELSKNCAQYRKVITPTFQESSLVCS